MNTRLLLSALVASWLPLWTTRADDPVGERPYEMVWANRTEDTRVPLLDFEDLEGWTVECVDAEATFVRSRREQLWGDYVGTLSYRGTGSRATVTLKPPKPIPVSAPFDCVNFWIHGNNWGWAPDQTTPQVEVRVLLQASSGQPLRVSMGRVRWKEWWVMHQKIGTEQLALLAQGGQLLAIEVAGCGNKDQRALHFDNLSIYQEKLPPLEFEQRPKRGLKPFLGQSHGTNTGPGTLPFPTREETILPDNLSTRFETKLESSNSRFTFRYQGDDGELVYRYKPLTGTLGDVTAQWTQDGAQSFQPMADGGVYFWSDASASSLPPEQIELIECRQEDDSVISKWRLTLGDRSAEVTYTLRLWQKSLVVDVISGGGNIGEFRVGKAVGVKNPRLVTLPYLTGDQQRPAIMVTGPPHEPLFVNALLDYYRSNASSLWAINQVADSGTSYNGGSRYLPKTDGRRNDCYERLFLTVSPRFEELLPNVPNPKSPWMHVTGERLWRAHAASNREHDYAHWKKVARYGMTKVAITDHETGWRDGGESFTLRTRAAPNKGGDEGQAEYARKIRALGFRYGIYNNYTDYAPVNEHWDEDYVTRLSDGQWQTAWPRCYNPKPARAVELEARLAPIIQQKFQLDTAYCDVHTAVRPWSYCDFDARVPGAGTFAATLYAYGEIMLHQKKTWNGPVYSEGNNHWYYCGLTDGNYAQDQAAQLDQNPWLVDFDLRKLHPLCCNFGMGNIGMFYGRKQGLGTTPEERQARLDRFLAATLAFGHTGFLVFEGGMQNAVRSYFNLQQVHANYARETVAEIRYADEHGNLLDTSAAVATGAYRRSQIVTRYSNGLEVTVNGHPTDVWETSEAVLPPNGWYAGGDVEHGSVIALSALLDGRRADYVDSPAYVYADGRGRFTRFEKAACDGQLIVHNRPDGVREAIPVGESSTFGVSMQGNSATVVALDEEGGTIGPAETRLSRGLVYVTPVAGAFSYLLKPAAAPEVSLECDREKVVPGEIVEIEGNLRHEFRIPADAPPGKRLWQSFDNAWIDFTVLPLVDAKLRVGAAEDKLEVELTPHFPAATDARIVLRDPAEAVSTCHLVPETVTRIEFPFRRPEVEQIRPISLEVAAGDLEHRQQWWLKAEESIWPVAELSKQIDVGQRLRGDEEKPLGDETRALVHWTERACEDHLKPCLFMHPPYMGGVGYSFALFPPVDLPSKPKAALRCEIGKADGSDPGDGILFQIAVVDDQGTTTLLAQKQWIRHAWTPIEADLSGWAGKRVRIKLIADVGPSDNSSGDWACWTNLRLETARPTLALAIHDEPVELRRQPGPYPLEEITVEKLRSATSGKLHYQGIGLQNGGQYVSQGSLNDLPLGDLPSAGGNEGEGIWGDASFMLTPEAIGSLGEWNRFRIDNPGQDCFKVGRFWIELELDDGRKVSSHVTNAIYTQPNTWRYAEGEGVPFEKNIEVEIRFAPVTSPPG